VCSPWLSGEKGNFLKDMHGGLSRRATLPFYTVIDCHRLQFLRDFYSDLAVIAVIFCQNDGGAPG
jgi:hypothetical protein